MGSVRCFLAFRFRKPEERTPQPWQLTVFALSYMQSTLYGYVHRVIAELLTRASHTSAKCPETRAAEPPDSNCPKEGLGGGMLEVWVRRRRVGVISCKEKLMMPADPKLSDVHLPCSAQCINTDDDGRSLASNHELEAVQPRPTGPQWKTVDDE